MQVPVWLHHQVADLLTDFFIPGIAAVLPPNWSNRLLRRAAAIQWLFPGAVSAIRDSEAICFNTSLNLPREWAWTTLMEAAQTWRLMLGLNPRLNVTGDWPASPGFIAAGMHYGAGIVALWHLNRSGLRPRFVFRPVASSDLPGRPVKLAWFRLRTRLIISLCPGGPISTGGAGKRILKVLDEGQATPIVLFDTPTNEHTDWCMQVCNAQINLRSGGARLFSGAGSKLVFFVVTINPATGQSHLTIKKLDSGTTSMDQLKSLMEAEMSRRPGQWLLWHSVQGLFMPASRQQGNPPPP